MDAFSTVAITVVVLLVMVVMNARRAGYWRNRFETVQDRLEEQEDVYAYREGEPRWEQMLYKLFKDKYYFEYGKTLDGKGELRVTRFGGTAWAHELESFYDENAELFGELGEENYSCRIVWIGDYSVFAVVALHRVYAHNGESYVYSRCFLCEDNTMARIAEFMFNYHKDDFAPPTEDNTGFDLSFIESMIARHSRYQNASSRERTAMPQPQPQPQSLPTSNPAGMPVPRRVPMQTSSVHSNGNGNGNGWGSNGITRQPVNPFINSDGGY